MQRLHMPAPRSQRGSLSRLSVEQVDFNPYHGNPRRASVVPLEQRKFIAWDGEGINRDGPGRPQSYVLFGCSTGDHIVSDTHLHTFDLLDLILRVGSEHPTAFHVGFAFNYDANMVLRSLHRETLARLHKQGHINLRRPDGRRYYVEYRPSKWFSVTKYGERYDRQKNPHDKTTVKIFDLFGFFTCSFEKAYTKYVGNVPRVVSEGKAARGSFVDIQYVLTYWHEEIKMLQTLAETLRRLLYGAGLRISSWHGPGSLASFTMRQRNIKAHMEETPKPVKEASTYAYAGGRFEMFKLGRTEGPVYSLDINSAYPFGIWQLPSLAGAQWKHVTGQPKRLARFGVYRVRLLPIQGDSYLERAIGPLFHRDSLGNISFPWLLDGWYWSPEVRNLTRIPGRFEIVEGWELQANTTDRPFVWVRELYEKRREWKSQRIAAEYALKLQLNSMYGKMAQRVGWDQEKRKGPAWHQLEWAGWVTSNTRAMLWELLSRIPRSQVVAVETDGLYTTMPPAELGIMDSRELGGWEVSEYDEILYVQSGMAWLRKGDEWTCKRRGLDVRTFSLDQCINYLGTLRPGSEWAPYVGETTRFIGLGAALQSNAPFKLRHCVWETVPREIRPGKGGKRVHVHTQCQACAEGKNALEAAHDMSIRSLAYGNPKSYPHAIPWQDMEEYPWRDTADEMESLYV